MVPKENVMGKMKLCACGHEPDDHVEDGCNARVGADGKLCPCARVYTEKHNSLSCIEPDLCVCPCLKCETGNCGQPD